MMPGPAGSGLELSPFLSIPLGILIGVAIGMLNGLMVQGLGVNPFIVTLGMLLTLKGAAAIPTEASTIYSLPPVYSWVGYNAVAGVSWVVLIAFTMCQWSRPRRQTIACFVFAGGHMTKRAGAMSNNEMQVRMSLKRCSNLQCKIIHHIQKGCVRLCLVCD